MAFRRRRLSRGEDDSARLLLAGKRRGAAYRRPSSDFRLLGHFERIIDLDAEIAHGAFQLGVTQK